MPTIYKSHDKVRYDLRPCKQVERLMLVDAFRRLEAIGMPIRDYHYLGMGAYHFYDFMLLHRLLGLTKMTSVEVRTEVERRVKFNKPLGCIDIKMGPIGDEIPSLSPDEQHIVWLDYDGPVEEAYLEDWSECSARLSPGSMVLITLDLEFPIRSGRANFLNKQLGKFSASIEVSSTSVSPKGYPILLGKLLNLLAKRSAAGRKGIKFIPLFNFVYRDSHRMITAGGMIGSDHQARAVAASTLSNTTYYRPSLEIPPYEIRVPVLTRKERNYLDAAMPASSSWTPDDFDLDPADLRAYREIYRFNPQFAELIF